MTPGTIIKQAQADGVKLALSPTGSIKAVGNSVAINRWLPVIRDRKAELLDELRAANECRFKTPPDAAAEDRRDRVLTMLRERSTVRYAVVMDTDSDPDAVIVALAIRGKASFELQIPREKWDGVLFLDLLDKHCGTEH